MHVTLTKINQYTWASEDGKLKINKWNGAYSQPWTAEWTDDSGKQHNICTDTRSELEGRLERHLGIDKLTLKQRK